MDDILHLGDDLAGLLDIPNSLCDDEIFRDIDTLDFVNEFDDDLIFDYDGDKNLSTPDIYKLLNTDSTYFHERNHNPINGQVPNHINTKANDINSIKVEAKENAEQKLMIIRELLDSNTCPTSTEIANNLQNCNSRLTNNKTFIANNRSGVTSVKSGNQRNITSKPPVILPSTNVSSSFLKSPTLAATLISIQPSKGGSVTESTHGTVVPAGRAVRHDSHNAIEKRYRLSINDKIDELRQMLFLGDDSKMNKSNVLKKAIERIKCLEDENNSLKCENYNLRISKNLPIINNGNSIESLNHTGSSPLSTNSDSGQSIENGSSSSSMHSSSVTSGSLFMPNKDDNRHKFTNTNRGIKRPLIYSSTTNNNDNAINTIKNEKLARLLLDPKDNYVEKQTYSSVMQNNRSSNNKSFSSNVPGFLLCTMALFVISFQPFDVILKKYQFQSSVKTTARHLLQYANAEDINNNNNGYLSAMLLTLLHWGVAFFLVWGSTKNRLILRKSFSPLFYKIYLLISRLIQKKTSHPPHSLIDLKNSLKDCSQDRNVFKSKLNGLVMEYGCSYKNNFINIFIRFFICLIMILIRLFRYNSHNKRVLTDTQRIRIHLLTVVIDHSFVDPSSYSRLEIIWYKFMLYALSWNCEVTSDTLYAKFVLSLSISTGFIRKYLLNKVFKSVDINNSLSDGFVTFVKNNQAQKLFIKTNPQKLWDRFYSHCLDQRISLERQSLINCYFMVHAQETIETASQIILGEQPDDNIVDSLKDIVNCCPTILNDDESTYFSLWCCLLLVLLKNEDNLYLDKVASRLISHYKSLSKKTMVKCSSDSMNPTITLKLLVSTLRLCGTAEDKIYHDINIQCIGDLQESSNTHKVFVMLLKLSHDRIIEALRTYNSTSSTCLSNIIYYTHAYSKQLNKQHLQLSHTGVTMVSEFEELLQKFCGLNPLRRQITSDISEKCEAGKMKHNSVKITNKVCHKITDFLSFDGDSKLRSH